MNDPANVPIDIEEQRAWLCDLHKQLGSWSEVGKRTSIANSTAQSFATGKYQGDNRNVAEKVYRYRQMLAAHQSIIVDMPERPGYFETTTSAQLIHMCTFAQKYSRLAVAALGPGNSKSAAAEHYTACFPNVFLSTMSPSTSGVNTMQVAVLESMGYTDVKGTPQRLSKMIIERCKGARNPLIILDEAQHLTGKALEEARSWSDNTRVGIGLVILGNAGVLRQLEGSSRQLDYAQLYSRIGLRLEQQIPLESDVEAFATAWQVYDPGMVLQLKKICMRGGGLRNGTHVMELAHMLAAAEQQVLTEGHIMDAWMQLSSRSVRT